MGHRDDTTSSRIPPKVIYTVFLLTIIATIVGLAYWIGRDSMEQRHNKSRDEAAKKVKEIQAACVRYQAERGKWPESISDTLEPGHDGEPYLAGGNAALYDPWGSQFLFEVRTDSSGKLEPVVWTKDPRGQRIAFPND